MNFQNLEYLLTVAEEMNVTRAAKRLHISEQALSRQIGKLETELSVKLFERNPRFTLSPAGKRLKAAAEQIGTTMILILNADGTATYTYTLTAITGAGEVEVKCFDFVE